MLKNLTIGFLAGLLFLGIFCAITEGEDFEKLTSIKISLEEVVLPSPFPTSADKDFCLIQSDDDSPAWYSQRFEAGDGVALYMDPIQCGLPDPYPFKITDVHFYLYNWTGEDPPVWPVEIEVNIRGLSEGDKCNGPGALLSSQISSVPIDSAHPNLIHFDLDSPCCIYEPFFLEIKYTGGTDSPYPSPLMTDPNSNPTDTCDAWYYSEQDGNYHEWYEAWNPPIPGYQIMRITGYTQAIECDSCWYWKPDRPEQAHPAPSGMPDFDQNQDEWQIYCGPTAVANCLWWLDAVPEGWTPPQLIDTLAKYFHTSPEWGTYVDTMQIGLEQYFQDYGFALRESTIQAPDFLEMEASLKICHNIILLLGFWWSPDGIDWYREGGHFVSMAGVCSESLWIALSDPDRDAAVSGGPGRVRPPDHPAEGTYGPDLHNDPAYVSHDIYTSTIDPANPSPGNPHWEIVDYIWAKNKYIGINVPEKFKPFTKPAPNDKAIYATEVEYAVMILGYLCGDCNNDGVINSADVVYLINYLFKGGPAPQPLEAGDVNSDGIINSADVVYLINYLFKGGTPPCD
jgi:hypothetical protein